jgi:translocation and assembly module TamA
MILERFLLIFNRLCLILLLVFSFNIWSYDVRIEGVTDPELLQLIQSASKLEKLKTTPPHSLTGLKKRAEGDRSNISQALQSKAYYDPKIDFRIPNPSLVILIIDPGSIYPLADFRIRLSQNGQMLQMCLPDLGIEVGAPALPEKILNAEDALLDTLNLYGYAFATIQQREVIADQEKKEIIVSLTVDTGPLTYFGPIHVSGLKRTQESFIYKKLKWMEGDLYDPKKIEKTQEALELSGLFRSVNIKHADQPSAGDQLPFQIHVVEAKQRSIGVGLNYNTILGPGLTAEWEDRNYAGEGQILSFRADVWKKIQEGKLSYTIPDFKRCNQNLTLLAEYEYENVKAFTERSFSVSATIERLINEKLRFSYGLMYKLLRSEDSIGDGTFDLIKTPLQWRWSNANSLLDPTKGQTLHLKIVPSFQVRNPQFVYSIHTFTGTTYHSLSRNDRVVLAAKLMLGSIIGASQYSIPAPERFYAGTENALRGYRYLTVSPLIHDKPIGGRSLLIGSLELRFRSTENWGWVAFYELGNVFKDSLPKLSPMLQSVGLGLRYHTPIGPLRLDIAFPLNKRKIDKTFQIYFSIGQAF